LPDGPLIDVWVNCPDRAVAESIGGACVEARLAACANVMGPISSIYRWEGRIERADEVPLLLKTRADLFAALCDRVKQAHPYETPSIVATELALVDGDYADWLRQETRA
jgi:periplasmic divalent cation tolerance protein